MRRNVRNHKVIRAISIGLATMIAVTSTPVDVFAEGEGEEGSDHVVGSSENTTPNESSIPVENLISSQSNSGNSIPVENLIQQAQPGSGFQNPVTVESASNDAATMVTTAEGQTAEIGKMTTLVTAENTFAQKAKAIEEYLDLLAGNGTAGKLPDGSKCDYANQIKDAETMAKNVEANFGITINIKRDENGNPLRGEDGKIQYEVVDQVDANGDKSITKKAEAVANQISSVKGENGEIAVATAALNAVEAAITGDVADKVGKENEAIKKAQTKVDGETARDNAKSQLDTDTTKKLNDIKDALETAVNEENINKAVAAAAGASENAVNVAGTQHSIAKQELQNAETAAQDAQNNISNYSRQQMVNIASSAQKAADNAKEAERLATEAFNTAKQNEDNAKTDLTKAQEGCTKAIDDAADVLTWYKGEIKKINDSITDANGPRATAKQAIIDANDAIDNALALMDNESGKTVTGAKTALLAYNTALTAIENVNTALSSTTSSVSSLMYPQELADKSKKTDEDKKILESYYFYNAEKKRKNTNLRLSCPVNEVGGTKRNLLNELETAFTTYKEAVTATGIAEENRKSAADTVAEINRIIDGIKGAYQGLYDMLGAEAEQDRKDLQALLSTGYTYKELEATKGRTDQAVKDAGDKLVKQNKNLGGSEEDQNLTADQVEAKYDKAESDNKKIDTLLNGTPASEGVEATKGLYDQIKDQQKIIADCNSNEGTLKDEYESAYGELSKDLGALDKKYVYSYNEETKQYEFATDEDGNPVYTDDYKKLVGRSQATKSEYKCGDEVLAPTAKPAYEDTGSKYMIDGDETVSIPEWIKSDKVTCAVQQGGYGEIGLDSDSEKLVQSVYCEYYENFNVGDSAFRSKYYMQFKNKKIPVDTEYDLKTQGETVRKIMFKEILSDVLHAELTEDDIVLDGNNKVKVRLTRQNASRLNHTRALEEKYSFSYSFAYTPSFKTVNGSTTLYPHLEDLVFENEGTIFYGTYESERTYDYKKYDLSVTPTPDALTAQGELEKIDAEAATAKGQLDAHKRKNDETLQAWNSLIGERAEAAKTLYGYPDGKEEDPGEGSLLFEKNEAEATKERNQRIITALGSEASAYKGAKIANGAAIGNLDRVRDFDPDVISTYAEKYQEGFEDYRKKYKDVADAKGKIDGEKAKAQGYQTTANNVLEELNKVRKDDDDPQKIYNNLKTKIDKAQSRLDVVARKLSVLKTLQKDAQSKLTGLQPISKEELVNLYNKVDGELKGLKKLDPKTYDPVELLKTDGIPTKVVTSDIPVEIDASFAKFLNNKLAAAIETATGILETAQGNLSAAIENRQSAEKKLKGGFTTLDDEGEELFVKVEDLEEDNIMYYAKMAREAAAKAAKALADWRAPRDDDDEGSGSTSGTDSYFYPVAETGIPVIDLTGLTLSDTGRGVAGVRTRRTVSSAAAADTSGVLGVKAEEKDDTKNNVIDENRDDTKKSEEGSKSPTKVADPKTPLADTPFEEGPNMNLLWLLGAAAAAGAGAYGYDKHRKKVTANDEAKKYKK